MKFYYRKSAKDLQWRWRLRASNNKIIAESGEGYHNKADCIAAIRLVQSAPLVLSQSTD
jgi:uncharacterized protein YegP (UPF0339 family)